MFWLKNVPWISSFDVVGGSDGGDDDKVQASHLWCKMLVIKTPHPIKYFVAQIVVKSIQCLKNRMVWRSSLQHNEACVQ